VFIRVYRLEVHLVMLVFSTQLCEHETFTGSCIKQYVLMQ
jgi:hypothetical protein